nr:hypothetical protein [Kibdelosporangium sp. MJ126-NF4]CEL19097.1 hypothetical protein [Kibdelosporangium sp. MJ126-NF4]CTQ95101.1 hypothetical protein [Kibdelosporangium sp. MJ126-NF4]
MVKKAGLIVAAAAAGLLMIGGPAFAGEPGNGGPGPGDGHGGPDVVNWADKQVGLVNIQGVGIANDWNINVNAGVCGIQGLSAPVASPIPFHECVTDSGIFDH